MARKSIFQTQQHNRRLTVPSFLKKWFAGWFVALMLGSPPSLAQQPVHLTDLSPTSLRGCFAMTADGKKMACFNKIRGEYSVEIKGTTDRRLYKAWPLPGHAEGQGASRALTKALSELNKRGFSGLVVAEFNNDSVFRIPGYGCELGMNPDTRYIITIAGDAGGPWIDAGGIGGQNKLAGVALDRQHSRIILTIDQRDESGETEVREYKIFPLSELESRAECRAKPSVP